MTALANESVRVGAEPFRAHLGLLLDSTGLPWPVLALLADVQPALVRHLLFGVRGHRLTQIPDAAARKLFALTENRLRATDRRWVSSRGARRDVARLLADGFPAEHLAHYCRLTPSELRSLLDAPRCREQTALLARSARLQFAPLRPTRTVATAPTTRPDAR